MKTNNAGKCFAAVHLNNRIVVNIIHRPVVVINREKFNLSLLRGTRALMKVCQAFLHNDNDFVIISLTK